MDTELDLAPLRNTYQGRGSAPHPPELLLKLLLFEHHRGRAQPIQWFRDLQENLAVQWLTFGLQVSKTVLYEFRDRVEPLLPEWLAQTVRTAVREGHTDAAVGSLDGTYVAANSSRHRTVTLETVDRRLEQLDQVLPSAEERTTTAEPEVTVHAAGAVDVPLADAVPTSATPPAEIPSPEWMSRTTRGRKQQRLRLRLAQQVLQERHAQNARRRKDKRKTARQIRTSLGDPQAVLGRDKLDVYRPLYNVQVMSDVKTDLALAYDVSGSISDSGQLVPMLDRTHDFTGCPLRVVLVDAGYPSAPDLAACQLRGVTVLAPWQENSFSETRAQKRPKKQLLPQEQFVWEPEHQGYRCLQGKLLVYARSIKKQRPNGDYYPLDVYQASVADCMTCPLRSRCTQRSKGTRTIQRQPDEEFVEQLRKRMQTQEAKTQYGQRCQTIERRFADLKSHRNFQRMSGQTPKRTQAQTGLTLLAHNLVTLAGLRLPSSLPPPAEIPTQATG